MKIALLQINTITGAPEKNADTMLEATRKARDAGADLCFAPELAVCGHNAGDLLLQSDFTQACRKALTRMAETGLAERLPPLLAGAPIANPVPQGRRLQNCAVFLHKGQVQVMGRKVLLPSDEYNTDRKYFEPGLSCGVLQFKGWRFAVTIAEDAWNDRTFWQDRRRADVDPVADLMNAGGADAIINLTALPYAQGLPQLHRNMLCRTAVRYRVPVLVVNSVGGNDDFVYFGESLVVDKEGRVFTCAPMFEESVLTADLVAVLKASPVAERKETDATGGGSGKNASGAALRDSGGLNSTGPAANKTPSPAHANDEQGLAEELWKSVVLGTRDFVRKCGFQSVVVGLSGGVDSALVAALAVEALGADKVTGLIMPSQYSSAGSIDDSQALADNLGLKAHLLPIVPLVRAFDGAFSAVFAGGLADLAEENIQARIRGNLLMAYSNCFGAMVLNTGNKSEEAVGFCTLYGDTVGGLAPIGDLYKHQVYALCRFYNSRHEKGIPEAVLSKAPSAELRPDQKDSDSLPPYEVLDPLLYDIIEKRLSMEDLCKNGHAPELIERVYVLLRQAEFKRRQGPPTLQLTSSGFGRGWSVPIAGRP